MSRLSTLYRPGWPIVLKYCLASFQADSTASEPLVVKKARFSRRQGRQPFGQLDRPRVRVGPEREVGEFGGLARAGLGHLLAPVPDLAHEQPGQAIQVALAAVVVDILPGPPDDHGHVAFGVGGHPREVQPHVAVGARLQVATRGLATGIAGAVRSTHLVPQL